MINKILFWILSEYLPNNGGKINKVKGKIVIINCMIGLFIPKYSSKYSGRYAINPIPAVFKIKTEIKMRITDFLDIIIIGAPQSLTSRILFTLSKSSINFLETMLHLKLFLTLL